MDSIALFYPSADQYRARAGLVRCTAEAMLNEDLRHRLLEIAAEYEHLATRAESGPRAGDDPDAAALHA